MIKKHILGHVIEGATIDGLPLQHGNKNQIHLCQAISKIFSGSYSWHTIDWNYVHYWGASTSTGKPIFKYVSPKKADALVDMIPCPKCGRLHCLLITYDPQANWYDELINIDRHVEEEGFDCWNCGLEMYADHERNVFVRIN